MFPDFIRLAFAGLVSSLLVICLSSCSHKSEAPAPTRPALTVELVSPSHESLPDFITASGEVTPWQEASIGAELSGIRIDEVLVNVGDIVKKNQLLARYDEGILRADLAQLDAAIAEASANLAKAKADASRADRLEASDAISGQTIQMYRTQAEVAAAQLASAQAKRDTQALKLQYARVVAPDDGVISSRSATVGAVSMSGTELFRLVRRNRLEWRAEVPAEAFVRLKPGISATLHTQDGTDVTGTLRQNAPTVDTGTRNGIAYVDLPANSGFTAGVYVTGRFMLGTRDGLVIPESAVVLRDGNSYLFKVDAKNRVHEVKVATGRRLLDAIEILGDAATPADRFVKSGGAFLSDGDLVQIASPAKASP